MVSREEQGVAKLLGCAYLYLLQVLPFILRRMKSQVLDDLPAKIIQDFYCDLSPLQALLYEDFSHSAPGKNLEAKMRREENQEEEESGGSMAGDQLKPKHHVLQVKQKWSCLH